VHLFDADAAPHAPHLLSLDMVVVVVCVLFRLLLRLLTPVLNEEMKF